MSPWDVRHEQPVSELYSFPVAAGTSIVLVIIRVQAENPREDRRSGPCKMVEPASEGGVLPAEPAITQLLPADMWEWPGLPVSQVLNLNVGEIYQFLDAGN